MQAPATSSGSQLESLGCREGVRCQRRLCVCVCVCSSALRLSRWRLCVEFVLWAFLPPRPQNHLSPWQQVATSIPWPASQHREVTPTRAVATDCGVSCSIHCSTHCIGIVTPLARTGTPGRHCSTRSTAWILQSATRTSSAASAVITSSAPSLFRLIDKPNSFFPTFSGQCCHEQSRSCCRHS